LLAERLKLLRTEKELTQQDVADKLEITRQAYNNYETGKRKLDNESLIVLSEFFGVSTDYLLGKTDNKVPIKMPKKKGVKIPVLGRVQAGAPTDAIEEVIGWEEITPEMAAIGEFFGLKIKGDSMSPMFLDGDTVIVKKQNCVENGEIAVVLVNGSDATVKKFVKHSNGVSLVAINPAYPPMFYPTQEVMDLPVVVCGKVKELRRHF